MPIQSTHIKNDQFPKCQKKYGAFHTEQT
jgi:hypothetical protein